MKNIREEVSLTQLEDNIRIVLGNITKKVVEKNYVLKLDGESVEHVEFIKLNLEHLTTSGRKKLSKRIYLATKKNSMGTLNTFLWYLKLKGIVDEKIKIEYSEREKSIIRARKEYKVLLKGLIESRMKYLEIKGDFYK